MRYTIVLFLAVLMAACGSDVTKEPEYPALDSVQATHAAAVAADSTVVIQPEKRTRCEPRLGVLNLESIQKFTTEVRGCDPLKSYFTIDGRIRKDNWESEHASIAFLGNMQMLSHPFRDLKSSFDNLSLLEQRAIIGPAMNLIAPAVVEYVHRSHLNDFLLSLDWERDIAWVDPQWYDGTNWPEDRFKPVALTTRTWSGGESDSAVYVASVPSRKLSKIDLWVRMFWLRRGELVFNTAKAAVQEAIKK
jgi:hypothetical protein